MDPEVMLNLMVELAGLEEELAAAAATLSHHTRRDLHLRQLQEEYEADTVQAEAEGRNAGATLRSTEARIQDIEAALAHKKDQMAGIADPRQHQALQTEIKALKGELDRLETEAIKLMDNVGDRDRKVRETKSERDTQEDRGSAEMARMVEETARARAAEQELLGEIERLTGLLPDQIARHVIRLRTQYPQAVVRVQAGACSGCGGMLPAQQAIDAEHGKALVRCSSCARYVVRKSWK